QRALSATTSTTGTAGSFSSSMAFGYDGQNRLTREETAGAVTTYTAWDGQGRPTAGTSVLATNTNQLAITYNDAQRVRTTTSTTLGQATVCSMTYDANGNPAAQACTGGGMTTTTTITTTATTQICA